MPLVLGIDEAGYGPLLGPLVVAATFWRAAPDAENRDLWDRLAAAVCRNSRRGDTRLPVGDSKQVFQRQRGLTTLERTVLSFADVAGVSRGNLGEFLDGVGSDLANRAGCPWYQDLSRRLPVDPVHSACEVASAKLRATMDAARVQCTAMRAWVVPEDVFNARLATTRNKASVLLEGVLGLIQWSASQSADQDLDIHVDRLGGRTDYRQLLMSAFPGRHLHVLEVSEEISVYRLASASADWRIEFGVEADSRHLPVALASMLAKYVRELLMERFNAFWLRLAPEVRPTAGYYTDAQRFLADIGPVIARGGMATESFVRAR